MDKHAGNFGDVVKHLFLAELLSVKLQDFSEDKKVLFCDCFGGNYTTYLQEKTGIINESSDRGPRNLFTSAYEFWLNNKTNNHITQSYYYKIIDSIEKKRTGNKNDETFTKYFGSTKLAVELYNTLLQTGLQINGFEISYNNFDENEMLHAKNMIHNDKSVNCSINFMDGADSYSLYEDYIKLISSAEYKDGVIFFDPYYGKKNKRAKELRRCKELLGKLANYLNNSQWSFVLWIPYNGKAHLDIAKEFVNDMEPLFNKNIIMFNWYDGKMKNKDDMTSDISGIGMIIINPPNKLSNIIDNISNSFVRYLKTKPPISLCYDKYKRN